MGGQELVTLSYLVAWHYFVKEIHSAGDYITYSYDSLGRVTEKQQYSSAGVQLYRTVYTYYSGLNLVKDMKDYEAGTLYRHTYYEYDSLGRISAKAESNSEMTDAEKAAKAVSYTYNLRGEVTGTGYGSSLTNIAAGEISGTRYEYNSYGQLTGVYVRKGTSEYKVKEYSYNPDGNVMQVKDFYNYTSGTGQYIALSYSYDAYGRVTAMVYEDSNGAVIEKHEYAYNRNGQVAAETNLNNVSVNPVNETRSYAYDYMGNLLKSEITGSANVTTLYTYDKVGNRLTKKQNNVTTTYTYNGLNQLTGESGGGNSLSYVYDANGNQIRITGTADGTSVNKVFAYTPSGMMSSYTSGTDTQVNRYNGDGQRVLKTEGSDVTNYFYQNGSVLYTTDSLGNVKAFNLLNVSDILGTLRINGNNVSSYFYTEDMRGSTVNVIDNSGNTVLSYWYDDFGQVDEYRESGNSLINEVQYTGAIYDELTGLLYLNARFYDPATGRFISQDTYRGERDDAGTWHLYAYCANAPVNYVDPTGHAIETLLDVAGLGYSIYQFKKVQTLANAGYILWDLTSVFVPFMPGSYAIRATEKISKRNRKINTIEFSIPNTVAECRDPANLTVGPYNKLDKMFKNQKYGKIEVHHIIEKRFRTLFDGFSPRKYPSVVLGKDIHKEITRRFKDAYGRGKGYRTIDKAKMKSIVREVYHDMPALRDIALEQIERYWNPKGR